MKLLTREVLVINKVEFTFSDVSLMVASFEEVNINHENREMEKTFSCYELLLGGVCYSKLENLKEALEFFQDFTGMTDKQFQKFQSAKTF